MKLTCCQIVLLVLLLAMIAAGVWGYAMLRRGFSVLDRPSAAETWIARTARHLSIPGAERAMRNPFSATPELLAEARSHFADHCALCHANDGSGDTAIGRGLYPKTPDLRSRRTQQLSDGELYWIIHNGIRLTGMPAWGERGERDDDSWKLALFIRHLPQLTPQDEFEMERLNPKSPAEYEQLKEEDEFLETGKTPAGAGLPTAPHRH